MPALQRAVKSYREYQVTNFTYIKQYSNQPGFMEYNSGVRLPLPTYTF
jgi:hypothetical protein